MNKALKPHLRAALEKSYGSISPEILTTEAIFDALLVLHKVTRQIALSKKQKGSVVRLLASRLLGKADKSVFPGIVVEFVNAEYARGRSRLRKSQHNLAELQKPPEVYQLPDDPHLHVLQGLPASKFYQTPEWRALRYDVMGARGRRCEFCGAAAANGATIHCDHILPRLLYPEKSLDPDNLQVLCEDCNLGKAGNDLSDWRIK